jgi:UDP-2-acetamido-2-deoxy-ribo-hexuluronate aminotransferase
MNKLQMVDLKGQYVKIKDEVDKSIIEVVNSTAYINGPAVKKFQENLENYMGVKHVIPCANGTDALQISMMGLGLKPGDEVITVDFTFAATVEVIALLNLTPVLIDVDKDTFNIDLEKLKKAITPKTKAIVPVHLFGHVAQMEEIMEIAKAHNLFVIEDNAQAIGANYTFKNGTQQKAGTIGDVGATSFFPSKNLGAYGDGGAIFTNNDELAHTLRGVVNHGMYERYHHDVVGVNSRLDSIQAAILDIKLKHLDDFSSSRQNAARQYNEALSKSEHIEIPKTETHKACDNSKGICDTCDCHVFHQYTIKIKNGERDKLVNHFKEQNIPHGVYYPIPLHLQKAYKDERYDEKEFTITNTLVDEVISLPMHTELDKEQIDYITSEILKVVG